jgi:hypothetical protein
VNFRVKEAVEEGGVGVGVCGSWTGALEGEGAEEEGKGSGSGRG